MATHLTAKIPFTRIEKMGFYENANKATLNTIYNIFLNKYPNKEIYLCNGSIYNMSGKDYWKPCLGFRTGGYTLNDQWTKSGIGITKNKMYKIGASEPLEECTDAVVGFPPLVENGKKSPEFSYCLDNTNRGRTMLGFDKENVIVSVIQDVSGTSDFTMDEEVTYMISQGCEFAINLDGGGSSQCNFNGSKIYSSRVVHNLFYMVVAPTVENKDEKIKAITVGDSFKLMRGSRYINGLAIPKFVTDSVLYVRGISKDNITFSTLKTGAITGATSIYNILEVLGTGEGTGAIITEKQGVENVATTTPVVIGSVDPIKVGSLITLKKGAKYTNGVAVPPWVFRATLYIREVNGDNVAFSTFKTGAITGVVKRRFVTVI